MDIFGTIVDYDVQHLLRPVGITSFVRMSAHLLIFTQCVLSDFSSPCFHHRDSKVGMDVTEDEFLKCQNETFRNLLIPCCEVLNLLSTLNWPSMHDEHMYIRFSLLQTLNLTCVTSNGWMVIL